MDPIAWLIWAIPALNLSVKRRIAIGYILHPWPSHSITHH